MRAERETSGWIFVWRLKGNDIHPLSFTAKATECASLFDVSRLSFSMIEQIILGPAGWSIYV